MFQTFDSVTRPEDGPPRLKALRAEIAAEGLSGFIVPRADAHQGEYVPPRDARLAWLTGFTGSAGFACVLPEIAGIFVDGRYRLQVRAQSDMSVFTPVDWPEVQLTDWLDEQGVTGTIGFDPWLHTAGEVDRWQTAGIAAEFRPSPNLIDRIWQDQPAAPAGRIFPWPEELAGESSASKRARLGAELARAGQSAAVLTLPDSIAWLLNIRGEDLPKVPVATGFAILHANGEVDWFLTLRKEIDLGSAAPGVRICKAEDFAGALKALQGRVRVDRTTAPLAVSHLLSQPVWGPDPCILPKARKNAAEIAGHQAAQLRDATAMCEFLCWLEDEAPKGGLTEIDVVTALEGYRRATNALLDLSFDTICGAGPNGAIMHYRVTRQTNRPIRTGELLVVDSGAQYLDGTTDITRTLAIGEVGIEEKTCFTRVLQGMIALSRVRFPARGVTGGHLDAIARYPLWLAHQDFDHGTGHGIGAYLSVHEGPQRFARINEVMLEPGMMLSNEPGYYRPGAFGIRIENLVLVEPVEPLPGGDTDRKMLGLRTLTWVPIDRNLIRTELLSEGERDWLNAYHAEVLSQQEARVTPKTRDWLIRACAPL